MTGREDAMTTSTTPDGEGAQHYVHDALFYDTEEDLLQVAIEFLDDGLDRGEHLVVVCAAGRNAVLNDALAAHHAVEDRVTSVGQGDVYPRTAAAVTFYRRFVEHAISVGAPGVRVFGEVPFGDDDSRWAEWGRFEAVCNVALADLPMWSVCAYDTRSTPQTVSEIARRTHPIVRTNAFRSANLSYVDPAAYLSTTDVHELPSQESPALLTLRDLHTSGDVRGARRQIQHALETDPAAAAFGDGFVTAAYEVIANAMVHGTTPVTVRLWLGDGHVVCTVTDRGPGFDDPFAGYWQSSTAGTTLPPSGLWLARQLCDDVTFHRTADEFVVRLRTALP